MKMGKGTTEYITALSDKEKRILQVLKSCDLAEGMSERRLSLVVPISNEETYQSGETICREDDCADKFYVIEEGKVALDLNLSTRPGSVKQATVDFLLPGQSFGYSALLGSRIHTTSARAISPTKLVVIDGQVLLSLIKEDYHIKSVIMERLAERFRYRTDTIEKTLAHILSVASHDLKAPLAAVQSYLQVILGGFAGELNERQRQMLSRSCVRIADFIEMLDNILDISRFEAGALEMEELPLPKVVRDTVLTFRPLAQEKNLNLVLDLPQEMAAIKGSAPRLKQVISNLVGNAIKFTPPPGEISVKLIQDDNYLRVEVADTGVGISVQDLPRIFDEFYRGVVGDTEAKGTGLGLSISKKIIEAHGGRIWAESPCPETGKGSKFSFTLPKEKA